MKARSRRKLTRWASGCEEGISPDRWATHAHPLVPGGLRSRACGEGGIPLREARQIEDCLEADGLPNSRTTGQKVDLPRGINESDTHGGRRQTGLGRLSSPPERLGPPGDLVLHSRAGEAHTMPGQQPPVQLLQRLLDLA